MFLNNEEGDLDDDDHKKSISEIHIFKEVFGCDQDINNNRGLISGTANERELFKHSKDSILYNCGNSAITSQEESCYVKEDLRTNSANWFLRHTHELSYSGHRSVRSLPTSGPSKRIVSDISLPAQAVSSNFVTCRLVESSSQGITSSCLSVKKFVEYYVREVDASKTVSSPVSHENSANKLLIAIPTVSHRLDIPPIEAALDCGFMNNPKSFLRNFVQELLMDAGWRIGRREREKCMGEYLYYSPWRRKPIRNFSRVWSLCGRRLFTDAKFVLQEDKKQWADMSHLCSDLCNTVMEIAKKTSDTKSDAALAQRWHLLDPFVNVVFIDKKLGTLKAGKSVRARRSLVKGKTNVLLQSDYAHIYGKHLEEELEDQPGDTSVVNESALIVYDPKEEGTWCKEFSRNKRRRQSMHFLKASGTDSNYDYFDCGLFEVPISYEDATFRCRGSDNVSPSYECNKFSSNFDRHRSDEDNYIDWGVKENKAADSYEVDKTFNLQANENIGRQNNNSYMLDIDIKFTPNFYETGLCDNIKDNISLEPLEAKGGCLASNECTGESGKKSSMTSSYRWIGTRQDAKFEKFGSQKYRRHMRPRCQLKDDDPCFSAIWKNKFFSSSAKKYAREINSLKSVAWKKHKSKKGSCRLVPRYLIKGRTLSEGESSMLNIRTVLSWLVDRGVISLGDTIQCRSKMDDTVVKYGLITRDGILCKCCSALFSVRKFSTHAGSRLNCHLYMESGKLLTSCQLEAWSAEYKARERATQPVNEYMDLSDDKCGLCGDMGELICCDNCPSTFHLACLETQELPEGSWYCMHCSCRVCGDLVDDKAPLKSHGAVMCLMCEHKYHGACLEEKGCREVSPDDSFCCQSCQEVYEGLNSRLGFIDHLSNGFSWTLLKCIRRDRIVHSAPDIALEAECNTKLAVALTIMEECFLSIVDSRTGIDMIPHVVYNWRSEYPRLNYNGFYTAVLEKDGVILSVASFRIRGITVAELPLVASCSTYQRQGMFRRLLHSIEELLRSFKVEKLVVSALPSLVEMWTIGFGFTPMDDNERNSLKDFNLMVFQGTVWLKKHIYGSPKTLQGHKSSSVTKIQTERTHFPQKPITESQKHPVQKSLSNEGTCKMEMRHMNTKNSIIMEQDKQTVLKMPWSEPDSSVGRIRVDVTAARENVLRMSQRANTSHDIC